MKISERIILIVIFGLLIRNSSVYQTLASLSRLDFIKIIYSNDFNITGISNSKKSNLENFKLLNSVKTIFQIVSILLPATPELTVNAKNSNSCIINEQKIEYLLQLYIWKLFVEDNLKLPEYILYAIVIPGKSSINIIPLEV